MPYFHSNSQSITVPTIYHLTSHLLCFFDRFIGGTTSLCHRKNQQHFLTSLGLYVSLVISKVTTVGHFNNCLSFHRMTNILHVEKLLMCTIQFQKSQLPHTSTMDDMPVFTNCQTAVR